MAGRTGKVIASKYRLDVELGRGGMGAVYRAFHLRVHKTFAVKLLHGEMAAHKSLAQRFFMEAQAAGRIGHPGILDVYDVGEDQDGTPFIVMELLRGEPLSALLGRTRIDVDAACWIADEVLGILEAAHGASVVHRDVKPQNIFLTTAADGTRGVKLLDFGIAKFAAADASAITRSGEIIGSPLYMAPEQAKGEADVDARVDIWSVGAVLFEMLAGRAAHAATSPVAVLAKILTEPAPPPSSSGRSIPTELDVIVQRALTIDRDKRFASAKEMRNALREVRAQRGTLDKTPALPEPESDGAIAVAPTIDVKSGEPPTAEPPLEAAVTKDGAPARARPFAVAGAIGVLAIAAILPWLVPGWRNAGTATAASASLSVSAPAPPPAASTIVEAPVATSSTPAVVVVPPPPASSVTAAVTRPTATVTSTLPRCAGGEVLSNGHCCPRGMVWQSGRCERPLATSF